jgi:hypothetical protein
MRYMLHLAFFQARIWYLSYQKRGVYDFDRFFSRTSGSDQSQGPQPAAALKQKQVGHRFQKVGADLRVPLFSMSLHVSPLLIAAAAPSNEAIAVAINFARCCKESARIALSWPGDFPPTDTVSRI